MMMTKKPGRSGRLDGRSDGRTTYVFGLGKSFSLANSLVFSLSLNYKCSALKLRYNIPLTTPMSLPTLPSLPSLTLTSSDSSSLGRPKTPTTGPNSPNRSPSPARTKFIAGTGEVPLIEFDAKLVARRDPGWDNMLETVLHCWVRAVVDEKRGSR